MVLAFFVWSFTGRKEGSPLKNFPGGARVLVIAAFLLVGTEILALSVPGVAADGQAHGGPAQSVRKHGDLLALHGCALDSIAVAVPHEAVNGT